MQSLTEIFTRYSLETELANLLYLSTYKVLICQDHGYALSQGRLIIYLREEHAIKGPELRAALEELQSKELELLPSAAVSVPSSD